MSASPFDKTTRWHRDCRRRRAAGTSGKGRSFSISATRPRTSSIVWAIPARSSTKETERWPISRYGVCSLWSSASIIEFSKCVRRHQVTNELGSPVQPLALRYGVTASVSPVCMSTTVPYWSNMQILTADLKSRIPLTLLSGSHADIKQNRGTLAGGLSSLHPKSRLSVICNRMPDDRKRKLRHAPHSSHSPGCRGEAVGDDRRGGDSGLLDRDCIVQTARRTTPSIADRGNDPVAPTQSGDDVSRSWPAGVWLLYPENVHNPVLKAQDLLHVVEKLARP